MDKIGARVNGWRRSEAKIFWGEIAPLDHMVQFYDKDENFFATLESFTSSGFIAGDCVVMIGTAAHRAILNKKLHDEGFDVNRLKEEGRYIELDAEEALSKFMVNNWPDRNLFNEFVNELLEIARKDNRKVRAFGEMVAVLWDKGLIGATVTLEQLWHELQHSADFSLYCAYPKSGFTKDAHTSLNEICNSHTIMVSGEHSSNTEIFHKVVKK
jgi:hypothetical protein